MFRILSITIILAASVTLEPLSCYKCIGSLTSDCFNGEKSSMVIEKCQDFPENITLHNIVAKRVVPYLAKEEQYTESKCVSYTSILANNGEHYIGRSCGYIYANVDICEYIGSADPNFPITRCSWCSTGLCNHDVL